MDSFPLSSWKTLYLIDILLKNCKAQGWPVEQGAARKKEVPDSGYPEAARGPEPITQSWRALGHPSSASSSLEPLS